MQSASGAVLFRSGTLFFTRFALPGRLPQASQPVWSIFACWSQTLPLRMDLFVPASLLAFLANLSLAGPVAPIGLMEDRLAWEARGQRDQHSADADPHLSANLEQAQPSVPHWAVA